MQRRADNTTNNQSKFSYSVVVTSIVVTCSSIYFVQQKADNTTNNRSKFSHSTYFCTVSYNYVHTPPKVTVLKSLKSHHWLIVVIVSMVKKKRVA